MDRRAVAGRKVGGVENVLDADRQAAQRQSQELRRIGGAARRLDVERRESADLRLARRNGFGAEIDHRTWGELAGFDPAREVECISISAARPSGRRSGR